MIEEVARRQIDGGQLAGPREARGDYYLIILRSEPTIFMTTGPMPA